LFPFSNIGAVGLAIPVDIDESTGKLTFHREAYTTPYPSPGLQFPTGFGPDGWLDWDPGPIQGTIDSSGQIVIPDFATRFWTNFSQEGLGAPALAGGGTTNLMTGIQARLAANRPWLFCGQPVGADGVVRLVGTVFVNFQLPLQTGTGLTCQLSPVPTLANLPKGATLVSAKGKVKPGPASNDDELTLTAVLASGTPPPVLDGTQDVLLRLNPSSNQPLNLYAAGGMFTVKGKKLLVQDPEGSLKLIQAITDQPVGRDQPPAPPATGGGSLTVTKGKKKTTLVWKVKGVETSQLTGAVTATVAIGTQSGTKQLNFVAGRKATKFH